MAKGNKSKSAKTTNQKKHKENLSKELRKKRIQKQKENEKQYAYNGGGTKVVQRSNRDVSAAPAMKGEKIKKGYVSTYPVVEKTSSGQGFFDQRLMLNEYLARGEKRLTFDGFMRNMAAKMNPDQMQELMTTNKDLVAKAATLQTLESINAAKNELHARERQIAKMGQDLAIKEEYIHDERHLNRELSKYERQGKSYNKTKEKLEKVSGALKSAEKAKEETDELKRKIEMGKEEHVAYLEKLKMGKTGMGQWKINNQIAEFRALKPDDAVGIESYMKPFLQEVEKFKKIDEQYRTLDKVVKELQDDKAKVNVLFQEIEGLGCENPATVRLITETQAKIKRNEDIYGNMEQLVAQLPLIGKQAHERYLKLEKHITAGKEAIDKEIQKENEKHEEIKAIMLKDDFYPQNIKDKILEGTLKENSERFGYFVAQKRDRNQLRFNDAEDLMRTLHETQRDPKYTYEDRHTFDQCWKIFERVKGKSYVATARKSLNNHTPIPCEGINAEDERDMYEADDEEQTSEYQTLPYDENAKRLFGD